MHTRPCAIRNILFNITVLRCEDGDLRIIDGKAPNEGRVENCLGETWGGGQCAAITGIMLL